MCNIEKLNISGFTSYKLGSQGPPQALGGSPFVPGIYSIQGAFLGTVAIRGLSDRVDRQG